MQLQEQVISLEQAKKLKELWFDNNDNLCTRCNSSINKEFDVISRPSLMLPELELESYPAYTASELMDILPVTIEYKEYWVCKLNIVKRLGWYDVNYTSDLWWHYSSAWKLVIALCETLIYLLENNLLPTTQSND